MALTPTSSSVILTVVDVKQAVYLQRFIHDTCLNQFVTITKSSETWKRLRQLYLIDSNHIFHAKNPKVFDAFGFLCMCLFCLFLFCFFGIFCRCFYVMGSHQTYDNGFRIGLYGDIRVSSGPGQIFDADDITDLHLSDIDHYLIDQGCRVYI